MSDETEVHSHEKLNRAQGSEVHVAAVRMQTNEEEIRDDNKTVKLYCDPCKTEDESVEAAGFCEECNELLCKDCLNAHKRVTVTRDHTIKEGYENLENGASIKQQKKNNFCPIHTDMELEYLCQTHDELTCLTCNSIIHNNCEKVENVSAICCHTDYDTEIGKIEHELESLLTDVENTSYEVKVSLDAVKLNHDEASARIGKVRKEMDDHLDQLQSKVQHEIDGMRKDDSQKMKMYGEKCKAIRFEVDSLRNKLKGNRTQSSQYNKFMALKSAQCLIRSSRNQLLEIRQSTKVNRYYFKPDQELGKLKTQLRAFGDIDLDSSRIKTAKYMKAITMGTQDSKTNGHITGMVVVGVNQIVTVDNSNKTMTLADIMKNTILSIVEFESAPWNAARLSDNILVVTLPEEKKIAKVKKTKEDCLVLIKDQAIAVNGKCYGLAVHSGKLFVLFSDLGSTLIAVLNETGIVLQTLKKTEGYDRLMLEDSHTAVDPACKYIFVSADLPRLWNSRNIIAVCLEDGKIKEEHSFTGSSGAITTDRIGTLFYCGKGGIYCFLRGCPKPSKIISTASGTSLAYCNKQNLLFVASKPNAIMMYYVV